MRCGKARRLMLLYRDQELTPELQSGLARHYAACAECAREAERIAEALAPVDALRLVRPVLIEPSLLTLGIMRGIENADISKRSTGYASDSVQRFLPVVRLVGAVGAILLVLLYATLSYNDARTLATLEERLTQRHSGKGSIAEQLAREVASQLESRNQGSLAEAGLKLDGTWRLLQILLTTSHQPAPVTLQEFFLRKYPALASVTLQDGLDEKELSILTNDGERFLQDMDKLIRKEKSTHAH